MKTVVDGSMTDITAEWIASDCSTGVDEEGSGFNQNCTFGEVIGGNSLICRNALVSIKYTIIHAQDEYSTITNMSVDMIVGDVEFDETDSKSTFVQSFAVEFSDSAAAASVSQANGNMVSRYSSFLCWCRVVCV